MFKKYLSLILIATAFMCMQSCKKGYLDVNQKNPNLTENPPINALLAEVTYQTGLNVYSAGNITSYYVQQLSSPNVASGSDIYDDVDRSTTWQKIYFAVQNSRQMKTLAAARNGYEHVAVAEITEAMNMSLLIDLAGDVPFSEAWNKDILKPKYDNAEAVYDSCLLLIDDAVANFSKPDPGIELDATNDLLHGAAADEKAAWMKTAYALKARLLNRLSKTGTYNPQEILAALANAYTSNDDDAQVIRFDGLSPWNGTAKDNASLNLDGWLSSHFVNALNGTTYGVFDPRIKYITNLTKFGDYRGTPNGVGRIGTGTENEECYLSLDGFYSKAGAPLLVITYAEMKFIEAEAKFATDKAGAYNAYLAGITANMKKIGVPDAEMNAYISNAAVSVGAAAFTKDLLFKEKYVAMFLQPEAWTDARRYDYKYKDFKLPANAVLTTFIRRIGYPTSEISRNASNVPAITSLADPLWWDK